MPSCEHSWQKSAWELTLASRLWSFLYLFLPARKALYYSVLVSMSRSSSSVISICSSFSSVSSFLSGRGTEWAMRLRVYPPICACARATLCHWFHFLSPSTWHLLDPVKPPYTHWKTVSSQCQCTFNSRACSSLITVGNLLKKVILVEEVLSKQKEHNLNQFSLNGNSDWNS